MGNEPTVPVPVPEDLPRFRTTLDFSDMEGEGGKFRSVGWVGVFLVTPPKTNGWNLKIPPWKRRNHQSWGSMLVFGGVLITSYYHPKKLDMTGWKIHHERVDVFPIEDGGIFQPVIVSFQAKYPVLP